MANGSCKRSNLKIDSQVETFLDLFVSNVRTVLSDYFVGLYLGGSLALGDFDSKRSDIDFLVATSGELPGDKIESLESMHTRLRELGGKWATRLDGSYVPLSILRTWSPDHAPCPFVEGNSFFLTDQGSAAIQRHLIRQHGIAVAGPPPHALIDPVDDLVGDLRDMLQRWWRPLLADPDWIRSVEKRPFAILTMCRALCTLECGKLVSKPVAARWVLQNCGREWDELVNWALNDARDTDKDNTDLTLKLIRCTLDRYQVQ